MVCAAPPRSEAGTDGPLIVGGGRFALLSDGYLFEPEILARRLDLSASTPDRLLLGTLLEREGTAGLARAPGDYALLWWDIADRKLTLAVSPTAERALYFHRDDDRLWTANFLPVLHAFPAVPMALDPVWLAATMVQRRLPGHPTPFLGIRKLSFGKTLEIDGKGERLSTLWRPDPSRRIRLARDADYAEHARDLLDRAVRRQMRGAATPAILMTAGLDSSAVAAAMLRDAPNARVRAYTAVPPEGLDLSVSANRYRDEREGVAAIARMSPGLTVTCHGAAAPAPFEVDPAPLFAASHLPFPAISNLGWLDPCYRRIRDDGHQVVLTGQQGNLVLSYMGLQALGDLFRSGRWATLARLLPAIARYRRTSIAALAKAEILVPALPPAWRDRLKMRNGAGPWAGFSALSAAFAERVGLEERLWSQDQGAGFSHARDSRTMRAHLLTLRSAPIPHESLAYCLYGIEQRDPFADSDLIDFCLAIPPEQYLAGGQTRSLARRALAGRLPDSILENRKVGAQCPEWMVRQTELLPYHMEALATLRDVPLACELIDLQRIEALLAEWRRDPSAPNANEMAYRYLLPRALHMGLYIKWSEGKRRSV